MSSMPPEWEAWHREGTLAASMIGAGVTSLSKATFATKGSYYKALFQLSIGFERAAKLIVLADICLSRGGAHPTSDQLKKIGHNIAKLLDKAEDIQKARSLRLWHGERPCEPIHQSIVSTLCTFARVTRYYNLDSLTGRTQPGDVDPLAQWWHEVVTPILQKHYSPKMRGRDIADGVQMQALLGPVTFVLHTHETGSEIDDVYSFFRAGYESRCIQKWTRVYVLQIARWLAELAGTLGDLNAYHGGTLATFGLGEVMGKFSTDDRFFRTNKNWDVF